MEKAHSEKREITQEDLDFIDWKLNLESWGLPKLDLGHLDQVMGRTPLRKPFHPRDLD